MHRSKKSYDYRPLTPEAFRRRLESAKLSIDDWMVHTGQSRRDVEAQMGHRHMDNGHRIPHWANVLSAIFVGIPSSRNTAELVTDQYQMTVEEIRKLYRADAVREPVSRYHHDRLTSPQLSEALHDLGWTLGEWCRQTGMERPHVEALLGRRPSRDDQVPHWANVLCRVLIAHPEARQIAGQVTADYILQNIRAKADGRGMRHGPLANA